MLLLTNDELWTAALERAFERKTLLDQRKGTPDSEYQVWHASSYSQPGRYHSVVVMADHRGVLVTCTCHGHENGHPCTHAAKVLERIGFLKRAPQPPVDPDVQALRSVMALALLNGDDEEYDRLAAQLKAMPATV